MYGIDRKQIIMMLILAGAIIFGVGYKMAKVSRDPVVTPVVSENGSHGISNKQKEEQPKKITVYICGAVKKPGVYSFSEGARIIEGVKTAEASSDAELVSINLAETMIDGQQIYVPRKGEEGTEILGSKPSDGALQKAAPGKISSSFPAGDGKININTAGRDEFDKLPGIGPSTAEKIIEYRATHGKFKNVSELTNVPGIGDKKLAKFRDKVRV